MATSNLEELHYAETGAARRDAMFAWLSLAALLGCIPWLAVGINRTIAAFYFARETHWRCNVITLGVTACLGLLGAPRRQIIHWILIALNLAVAILFGESLMSFVSRT